jgi:hypothetical protein
MQGELETLVEGKERLVTVMLGQESPDADRLVRRDDEGSRSLSGKGATSAGTCSGVAIAAAGF